MIRKASVCLCMICLSVFLVQGVMADTEYVLEKIFTSMTPVYMNGHEGDAEWIEGFDFECDILLEGDKIGTASGRSRLINPPVNLIERYDVTMIKFVNSIPGQGNFEESGLGIGFGSSTVPPTGNITVAWWGSITNGTDSLENIVGVSAGTLSVNAFTGQGSGEETILIRFGY